MTYNAIIFFKEERNNYNLYRKKNRLTPECSMVL